MISALLACGTCGQKTVVDGCKLLMVLHKKYHIEEHLESRGFGKELKKSFLDKMFRVQNSDKKLCDVVDCSSEEEFDLKLFALESVWNARGDNVSEQWFHKWFILEKVNTLEV